MSRLAALTAVAAALAAPASAQVSILPLAGYDVAASGPSLGLGAEARLTAPRSPYSVSLRPTAEYVFAEDQLISNPYAFQTGPSERGRARVIRGGVDLVARVRLPGVPVSPYVKAGVVAERRAFGEYGSETNLGAVAGAGVEVRRMFVEGTVGTAAVSTARLAVGVRF